MAPAALRRLVELGTIDAGWNAEMIRLGQTCGHDQAVDAHDVLMDQVDAICASEIEPQTLEGVAVRAGIVAFQAWHLLFKTPKRDMDWEEKMVRDAIGYLDLTVESWQWVATLYSHVFAMEHDRRSMGPHISSNRST